MATFDSQRYEDSFDITFELEPDPIRINELSGFHKQESEGIADKKFRPLEQQLLQEGRLGDSDISARIKTAMFGSYKGQPACLVLLGLEFCPKHGKRWFRFRNATVQLEFDDAEKSNQSAEDGGSEIESDDDFDDENYTGPLVLQYYPDLIRGHIKHSADTYKIKLYAEPAAAGVGTSIGGSRTLLNEGLHLIHGRLVGDPQTRVKWTINENEVTRSGIYEKPSFAVIVRYEVGRGFAMKLSMKATTFGGLAVRGKKGSRIIFKHGQGQTSIDLEQIDLEEMTNMKAALLGREGPGAGEHIYPPPAE